MGGKMNIDGLRTRAEVGSNSQVTRIEVINLGVDQIITREPFESLFPIEERVLQAVIASIEKRGFDPHDAPEVMKETTMEGTKYLLLDGHTRLRAALELQLNAIPVRVVTFSSENEALLHAFHKQIDRRNLDDAQIMRVLSLVDKKFEGFRGSAPLAPIGANGAGERKSAARTGRAIGVNPRKIERARKVVSHPEVAAQVERGEISIYAGYEQVRAKERGTAAAEDRGEPGQLTSPMSAPAPADEPEAAVEESGNEGLESKGGSTEQSRDKGADWTSMADRVHAATGAAARVDLDPEGRSGRLVVSFSTYEELSHVVDQLCR
jgi:ParB-like chromosome segregation protein Spo0J